MYTPYQSFLKRLLTIGKFKSIMKTVNYWLPGNRTTPRWCKQMLLHICEDHKNNFFALLANQPLKPTSTVALSDFRWLANAARESSIFTQRRRLRALFECTADRSFIEIVIYLRFLLVSRVERKESKAQRPACAVTFERTESEIKNVIYIWLEWVQLR